MLKFGALVVALAAIGFAIAPLFTRLNGEVDNAGGLVPAGASTTTTVVDSVVPTTLGPIVPDSASGAGDGSAASADPTGTSNVVGLSVVASCTARGSTDSRGTPIDFKPENAIDGDPATAWRCPGDGAGTTFDFTLPGPTAIGQVGMIPGFDIVDPASGDDRFLQNRRVASARWACLGADGTELARLDQRLADDRALQTVVATGFDACASVRLELLTATGPGSRDFVAISEIRIAPRT